MSDFYSILGIRQDSKPAMIKSAFRRLAHRYHPDRNPDKQAWAEVKMRDLIEAYRILSDPVLRSQYDNKYRQTPEPTQGDPYVNRLRRMKDTASRIELMVYQMYEGHAEEGLKIYEILVEEKVRFSHMMELNEYLDIVFLVAEERQRQKKFLLAFNDYMTAYKHRGSVEAFGLFREEILERMISLFLYKLKKEHPAQQSNFADQLLRVQLQKGIRASILKRKAELNIKLNQPDEAKNALLQALKLKPSMPCKKLKQRCGIIQG